MEESEARWKYKVMRARTSKIQSTMHTRIQSPLYPVTSMDSMHRVPVW